MAVRLRIVKVDCAVDDDALVLAQVKLSLSGRTRVGRARSPIVDGSWRRAVADATINAIRMFLDSDHKITLDAVMEVTAGKRPLIVVTLTLNSGHGELFLAGAAQLEPDRHIAVTKAILHALNRQLEMIVGEAPRVSRAAVPSAKTARES